VDNVLPVEYGKIGVQYSESQNMLVTKAYTSAAGNTYFNGIRLSDRIYIRIDIGIGYAYTFLNGLAIYANHKEEKKMVGNKSYHSVVYSEARIKEDAKAIVKDKLVSEAKGQGLKLDENWLSNFVSSLVEDTYKNQIETLKQLQVCNLLAK
jgi:hypothetical protein